MKCGIVTWVKYDNLGSLLQAYALQKTLESLGMEAELLDDSEVGPFTSPTPGEKLKSSLAAAKNRVLYPRMKGNQEETRRLFAAFRARHLRISKEWRRQGLKGYDAMVCGSDQIWCPENRIYDPHYYAASFAGRKVAYAPSLGVSEYPRDFYEGKTCKLIEEFGSLSCREKTGARLLGELTGREVPVVCDPTLLLERKDWEELVDSESPAQGKYAVIYFLSHNEKYVKLAMEYAKAQRLKPIVVPRFSRSYGWGNLAAAGPAEFLTLIAHSDCVLTDSFHATLFALQFEKRLVVFQRFGGGKSAGQNCRINELFERLGIDSGHFHSESSLEDLEREEPLDFKAVKGRMRAFAGESREYLRKALAE